MNKLFNKFGLTIVFEQDPEGGDANNPNPTGGEPDPAKGGGGGGNEPDKKEPPKDQTYELKVNGETRQVTLKEMQDLAQKASGADAKFEEASDLRKQAQDGLRIKELFGRLSDGNQEPSETDIKEFAGMVGVDPAEFKEYLAGDPNDGDDKDKNKHPPQSDPKAMEAWFQEQFGISPAEARQRLDFSHRRHIDDAKKEIRRISDGAVDKDEIFGKIKIGEKAEDRLAVIKDRVAEDVLGRIQDGEPFGTELDQKQLLAASVQKIRAYLTKFGIPGKPDQYPVTLGLGPSQGLPAEVQSEEPIKRKSAAEDAGGDNFTARWMQKGLKKLREAGRK